MLSEKILIYPGQRHLKLTKSGQLDLIIVLEVNSEELTVADEAFLYKRQTDTEQGHRDLLATGFR